MHTNLLTSHLVLTEHERRVNDPNAAHRLAASSRIRPRWGRWR